MIKKPVVTTTNATPVVATQPLAVLIKPPQVKKTLTFQQVLENIKNFHKLDADHEIDDMVDQLAMMAEKEQLIKYLVEETKNSRFTAYRMAMRNFHSTMSRYFEGLYKKSDLETYRDNLSDDVTDPNYHDFYKFRIYLINSIINNRHDGLAQCSFILCYGTTGDSDEDAYKKYEDQVKAQIINLSQLVWPNEAKALKIMLGDINGKR